MGSRPAGTVVRTTHTKETTVTGTPEALAPHRTGLRTAARKLARELKSCPEDLSTFFRKAREYEDLEDALQFRLEYADYMGEDHDPADVAEVRGSLEQARRLLLDHEQDPALREEAVRQARRDIGAQDGDDDPVAIALLVDLVSFTCPQDRLLTMLIRSLVGQTFIDQTVIFDAPRWVARWLGTYSGRSGRESIDVLDVLEPVWDPGVLLAATALWEPLAEGRTYQDAAEAIEAARHLV